MCYPLLPISPSPTAPKQGFALIIALSLMAFVLLLLLSITTLVQVETQSAQISVARMEAQQNALLGLKQALGELQMAAGPDQRVTVSSEMFDSDPETAAIEDVATRHYTGVFRAHDTNQPLEAFRASQDSAPESLKWLASAENTLTDPVTADPSAYSTETISIAKVHQADTNTLEDILVGKISIDEGAGSYAWWVADEGMKAKFNTADPGIGLTDTEGPFDPTKLELVQARQSNFSHVSEGFSQTFTDLISDGALPKLISTQGFNLLSSEWGDWMMPLDPSNPNASANVNSDVTLFSRGLPVDVTQGRLKEDLTVYLETGEGLDDGDHIVRGSSDDDNFDGPDFGASLTGNPVTDNMPRFGLLRSWHDLGKDFGDNGTAQNQPQTNTEHGLHPAVMRAGFSLTYARVGTPTQDPDPAKPDNMLVEIRVLVFARVTLLNPYNMVLPPEQYLFEMTLPEEFMIGWVPDGESFSGPPSLYPNKGGGYEPLTIVNNMIQAAPSYKWHGGKPWLRMVVDTGHPLISSPGGMLPGETLSFSPEAGVTPLTDSIYLDQAADKFNAEDFVNYTAPVRDQILSEFTNYFVLDTPISISVPKDATWFPSDSPPDYQYMARYKYLRPNGDDREDTLSWRLSLLTSGDPVLLSTKDPSKTMLPDLPRIYSTGNPQGTGDGVSFNWDNVQDLNGILSTVDHSPQASKHDYWYSAARYSGGARQGGGRRNALRNPRGGILRDTMDLSGWSDALDRISVHQDGPYEAYWSDTRWRNEYNTETNHLGVVEGFYSGKNRDSSNTWTDTGTRYTSYDFPRRFGAITSLGQLQHANLNPFGYGSDYQVGFSRAPVNVERDSLVEDDNELPLNDRIDLPFMLNASLWDRFYLSTIPQSGGLDLVDAPLLANNSHVLVPDSKGVFPDLADLLNSETGFKQSAASIMVNGAFNINSVSVDAWEALLMQSAGKTIQSEREGKLNDELDNDYVTFPRFPDPVYGSNDSNAFETFDAQDEMQFAGLFVTDRADIRVLAETIVAEVKRRGPFLSMADFINRRQIEDASDLDLDYQGLMGTLDAAIMRSSQNQGVLNYEQIFSRSSSNHQQYLSLNLPWPSQNPVFLGGRESDYGVPEGHSNTALEGSSANLTQGDILQALGPQLSARSDTFIIRAYGEATDAITGDVNSSARCEAIVQRVAEPVASSDSLVAPAGQFGRRFVVLNFRWIENDS